MRDGRKTGEPQAAHGPMRATGPCTARGWSGLELEQQDHGELGDKIAREDVGCEHLAETRARIDRVARGLDVLVQVEEETDEQQRIHA